MRQNSVYDDKAVSSSRGYKNHKSVHIPRMHIDLMGEIDSNTIIAMVKIPHFNTPLSTIDYPDKIKNKTLDF